MKCPWCNSTNVDVPTVDIGVGEQQVAPATCMDCEAAQIHLFDFEKGAPSEEERAKGWWRGCDAAQ